MMRDLSDASENFAGQHDISEIALDATAGYKSMMLTAFEAGAFWATRHRPDHDQQVADVDVILKGLGFGILTTARDQVDAHRRYAAVEIVDALPLSDSKEES
jgi:hypothetical protein